MSGEISHKGVVVSSDPNFTQVEILRQEACSLCRAKELCGISSGERKVVTVATDPFNIHDQGDEVELCMKPSMGAKAVWISYVVPLIVLFATLFALKACGCGELACALGSLASVVIYYIVLFCFRSKLEKEFEFYIKV